MGTFCTVFLFKFLPGDFITSIPDVAFNNEYSFLSANSNGLLLYIHSPGVVFLFEHPYYITSIVP
jgi:hypothetical protein